jgi:hypothetical protein
MVWEVISTLVVFQVFDRVVEPCAEFKPESFTPHAIQI